MCCKVSDKALVCEGLRSVLIIR